jgi:hypothetical protein
MARPSKYPWELMDRGIRLAREGERPIPHIAHDLGIEPESLRGGFVGRRLRPPSSRASPQMSGRGCVSCAGRTLSCGGRTRSSNRRRCFLRGSSTQTGRSDSIYGSASRALRGRGRFAGPCSYQPPPITGARQPLVLSERRGTSDRPVSARCTRPTMGRRGAGGYGGRWPGRASSPAAIGCLGWCAKRVSRARSAAGSRGRPPNPTRTPTGGLIWSTSPRALRTSCGWPTCRICAARKGAVFRVHPRRVLRRVVRWQLAPNMRTDVVLGALKMARVLRGAGADVQLVHRSDRGSQYTSFD